MSWISLITALLRLAGQLASWAEQRRLMSEGERRAIARELAKVAEASNISREVEEEIASMAPKAVDAAMEEWYRDY